MHWQEKLQEIRATGPLPQGAELTNDPIPVRFTELFWEEICADDTLLKVCERRFVNNIFKPADEKLLFDFQEYFVETYISEYKKKNNISVFWLHVDKLITEEIKSTKDQEWHNLFIVWPGKAFAEI